MTRSSASTAVILFLLAAAAGLSANEAIVGRFVGSEHFRAFDSGAREIELRLADVVTVSLDDHRFYDAVEMFVELPQAIAQHPDLTLALLLYGDLSSQPAEVGSTRLTGRRLHFLPVTERRSPRIRLPVTESPNSRFAGTLRPERIPTEADFPLAVTVLPIGKSFPESLQDETVVLTIRPVTRGLGALRMQFVDSDGASVTLDGTSYELSVGDRSVDAQEARILLAPGFHRVEFSAERYQTVTMTAAVEEGRERTIALQLEPLPGTLRVIGPRGSLVSLNNQLRSNIIGTTIDVPVGRNVLTFRIGDRTVSQAFEVESGRHYEADLELVLRVVPIEESTSDSADSAESETP